MTTTAATTAATAAATTAANKDFSFSFVKDLHDRALFVSAFNAISECELWYWFKAFDSSSNFMFSTSLELDMLHDVLRKDPINSNHSGGSFAFMMRQMEYIAKNGYENYKSDYLKNK